MANTHVGFIKIDSGHVAGSHSKGDTTLERQQKQSHMSCRLSFT